MKQAIWTPISVVPVWTPLVAFDWVIRSSYLWPNVYLIQALAVRV